MYNYLNDFFKLSVEKTSIKNKSFVKFENSKFEKSIGETVKLKNQKDNFSETPEQKKT